MNPPMEEEPVHIIRENTRNLLKLNRQQQRDEVNDLNRSISKIRITPESISNIALNLKTKSHISATDLNILKIGLIDNENNKSIVLSTQGALRGLIRELTESFYPLSPSNQCAPPGQEVRKQCAAAGCLCNLALTDGKACNTIAKAAGFYLITMLDNFTMELGIRCALTLGNLAGSSAKVCELLTAQGAVTKLCDLLQGSKEVQDAALYALVHLTYQLKDQLRVDHLKRILQELIKIQLTMSTSQLLFILSCHTDFLEVNEELSQKVLTDFPTAMKMHFTMCKRDSGKVICCKLIYLLRVLGNMDISKIYEVLLDTLVNSNINEHLCKILIEEMESVLHYSLIWLLGNMYNFNTDNKLFYKLLPTCSTFEVTNV